MEDSSKAFVILLADDDADDRLLVQDAMIDCNCSTELRQVENGEELMDYLLHRGRYQNLVHAPHPGLILLDLNMPRKDGREVLREIRSNPELRRIPVVVLTTSEADTDIDSIYELGANSFISKPVRFESLVKVIRTLNQYWFDIVQLPASK